MTEPASNPFSTRFTRPGALAYRFPPGTSAADLVARLEAQGWQGEICGPHGSGKSTLLAALRPALEAAGRRVRLVTLHDGCRRLPLAARDWPTGPDGLLIVDGYEQLGRWERWRVRRRARTTGVGLLVTTHAPTSLPRLFETRTTLDLAAELFGALRAAGKASLVDELDLARLYAAHRGDLREVFFGLYDLYEARRA